MFKLFSSHHWIFLLLGPFKVLYAYVGSLNVYQKFVSRLSPLSSPLHRVKPQWVIFFNHDHKLREWPISQWGLVVSEESYPLIVTLGTGITHCSKSNQCLWPQDRSRPLSWLSPPWQKPHATKWKHEYKKGCISSPRSCAADFHDSYS